MNKLRILAGAGRVAMLAGMAWLLTGCCTSALWERTAEHRFQPVNAQIPQVFRDARRQDFLVLFTQYCRANHGAHPRQARYYLKDPEATLTVGKTSAQRLQRFNPSLQALPVYGLFAISAGAQKRPPAYATYEAATATITVYLQNGEVIADVLPTSTVKCNTAARVLIGPLTIAADSATHTAAAGAAGVMMANPLVLADALGWDPAPSTVTAADASSDIPTHHFGSPDHRRHENRRHQDGHRK